MKNYVFAVVATAMALTSCRDVELEENYKKYAYKVDSLSIALTVRDSTINDFLQSFNEIEQNLDSVQARQNMLRMDVKNNNGENGANKKERINMMIVGLNEVIEANKEKIESLNKKLKNSTFKIKEFQTMINNLNEQIVQKNLALEELNGQLAEAHEHLTQLQTSIDTLTNSRNEKMQTIAAQTATIHTAYYVIGKTKELEEIQVIDKKGGLLGIGKTTQLNAEFDKNNFKQIDYTQVMSIPIYSKKAKVITTHPADTYILEKNGDNEYTNLKITNPEKFWSASKYLVVVN